jgi:hypothetical protein
MFVRARPALLPCQPESSMTLHTCRSSSVRCDLLDRPAKLTRLDRPCFRGTQALPEWYYGSTKQHPLQQETEDGERRE